jgi:hypothetical protein
MKDHFTYKQYVIKYAPYNRVEVSTLIFTASQWRLGEWNRKPVHKCTSVQEAETWIDSQEV